MNHSEIGDDGTNCKLIQSGFLAHFTILYTAVYLNSQLPITQQQLTTAIKVYEETYLLPKFKR